MNLKPIEEQVVVVVGANSGIGRETALKFAERGAKVVADGRSLSALDELAREIQSRGGQAARTPEHLWPIDGKRTVKSTG